MRDRRTLAALPAALLAALLVLATLYEGAFDVRQWAPLALFALALLGAVIVVAGGARPLSRTVAVAVAAIWALAAWSMLSMTWAESPEHAWEGAAQTTLYAGLFTVVVVAVPGPRQMAALGAGLVGGIVAIALLTLVRLHVDGGDLFVAGRLDSPAGYRNATAALFAIAFWPLIGAAVSRGRNPTLRASAFAAAVLCLGLAFLTQSRGVLVALAVGGAVALALGTERIRRAFLALVAAAGVLVLSGPLLVAYRTFEDGPGPVTLSDIESATNALTFLFVDALIVGLLLALLDGGLRASVDNLARARRIAVVGLAVGAVGLFAGGVMAAGNPLDFVREKAGEFQAIESRSAEFSELVSTGGQRYDLWRVALDEFAASPLLGVGEGSYAFDYYVERDTDRNLSNPHSLPLRTLAELGIVGTLLLAAFFAAIGVALARGVRGQALRTRHAIAGLAGGGAVVVGQSTVDWIWAVPGVTGIGLLALGLASGIASAREAEREAEERARARREAEHSPARPASGRVEALRRAFRRSGLREGLPAAGLLATGLSVVALFLADHFVREARTAGSPAATLDAARTAGELNPWSLTPLYLEASALEAAGRMDEARATLEQALALEPRNFATLGLLGDLAARRGDHAAASELYARAAGMNPMDAGLGELARQAERRARAEIFSELF